MLNPFNWAEVGQVTAVYFETTWCIALPTNYHYFRVRETIANVVGLFPPANLTVNQAPGGIRLDWTGGPGASYKVDWTPTIAPTVWTPFTNVFTSTNTSFTFTDDGSQTGGLGGMRYYRVYQVP